MVMLICYLFEVVEVAEHLFDDEDEQDDFQNVINLYQLIQIFATVLQFENDDVCIVIDEIVVLIVLSLFDDDIEVVAELYEIIDEADEVEHIVDEVVLVELLEDVDVPDNEMTDDADDVDGIDDEVEVELDELDVQVYVICLTDEQVNVLVSLENAVGIQDDEDDELEVEITLQNEVADEDEMDDRIIIEVVDLTEVITDEVDDDDNDDVLDDVDTNEQLSLDIRQTEVAELNQIQADEQNILAEITQFTASVLFELITLYLSSNNSDFYLFLKV